ncbi:hypothetical protein [Halopiger goleimassiliensis]|uniref:hypothetical protein n=1 Tax=Halopiger goleimassiliensis TaxID=1293048 RepID=UPI00067812BE|nr:hypothetical protein [Halopiger goleimassiliensis]
MRRRELIVGSGTVAAIALSGYAGAATADADDEGRTSLPSDLESVLELVPGESALDTSYRHLIYVDLRDSEAWPGYVGINGVSAEIDDIDADSVAETAIAFGEETTIAVISGSFDRPDGDEEIDGWTVGTVDGGTFAATDGRLVAAEGDGTAVVETAIAAANGDEPTVITDPETTESTFEFLDSKSYVTFVPDFSEIPHHEFDGDVVEAIGTGREVPPSERTDDDTLETEYVLHLADDADVEVDGEWVRERIERLEQGDVLETTFEQPNGDRFVHVEAVVEQPPERDRDAAPDARIRARSNADEGTVTFEHDHGEPIDTAMLEVWNNGELADEQLADEHATFAEGDTFELETGPLADVGLRWFDEAENVYYYYDTTLVGSESFETTHDLENDAVEITYVGELAADPDLLELVRQEEGSAEAEQSAIDVSGSLTAGDTIVAEDVTLGDGVSLRLSVPANPNRGRRSLVYFRVRPPRMRLSSRHDSVVARYWSDVERDADEFRVLVEGEPADVQFTDVTDTLSENDEVDLGDIEHGTHVAVEWLEPDDPEVIAEQIVRPTARADLSYDDSDGTVTVEYTDRDEGPDGDAIDADELELRVAGEPAGTQPSDEFDTFEPGDAFTVDVEPVAHVELVWVGPQDTEQPIGQTTAGRESFDAEYDPDAEEIELVYTGEQPGDPSNLTVALRGDETRTDEELFAQEHDTLTDGDSVVLEDVDVEDRVSVRLVQEGDNYVSSRSIFRFRAEPRWAFSVDERENGLVAVYREHVSRDADNFRVLVDGEPAAVQPADHYDTLTDGDEFELGEFEVGTVLTLEWTVPDDPREVLEHVVAPDAEFDVDYDEEAGELTVEHTGGDAIDATDLGVVAEPTMREPTDWDGHETVSEGDATTVDLTDEDSANPQRDPIVVGVVYRDSETITYVNLED